MHGTGGRLCRRRNSGVTILHANYCFGRTRDTVAEICECVILCTYAQCVPTVCRISRNLGLNKLDVSSGQTFYENRTTSIKVHKCVCIMHVATFLVFINFRGHSHLKYSPKIPEISYHTRQLTVTENLTTDNRNFLLATRILLSHAALQQRNRATCGNVVQTP